MVLPRVETAKFHRLFYPVVPVLVVVAHGRRVGGMTAISCAPVSLSPPLVALSVAPTHHTYELLQRARRFSLNWLGIEHGETIAYMGSAPGRRVRNKVEAAGLSVREYNGVPAIKEARAVMTCAWRRALPTGDHMLVVAAVRGAYADPDFHDYWRFRRYRPTLYVGGGEDSKGPEWFRTLAAR